MISLSNLAREGDDDKLLIGKRPNRIANQPQELYNVDEEFPEWHKNHYIGSDKFLKTKAVRWYEEKTGFPLDNEHANYFFSLPRGLANKLAPITKGDIKYECGIAFCHLDGEIYQYRPWEPIPTREKVGSIWQPGRPIKYITITKSVNGVTLPPKPLFLPKLKEIPNSPNILVVTEGFTKAACLSQIGFDSVHIAGVTCWDTLPAKKLFESIKYGYDYIVLAFDMDAEVNQAVRREQLKFCKRYGAKLAIWTSEAKGFDDLCISLKNDEYALRHIILSAEEPESDYYIPSPATPYPHIYKTISEIYPTTYYDGAYWYIDHKKVDESDIDKMFIAEFQKFYSINDRGRNYAWGTKYSEVLSFVRLCMTKPNKESCTYVQNGVLDKGIFIRSETPDPRALPWRVEEVEEPTELINFLLSCHGNLNYRYWLRSLFDNSIPYGAILGVTGHSGSGKSLTLRVAQNVLTPTYCHSGNLSDILIIERLAALGNPKAYIQSDCQELPARMDELFNFSDSSDVSGRALYSKSYSNRRFHCRIAYGFVNIQHNNSLNEGFGRRSKIVTCHKYPGLKKDAGILSALLEDPTYLNRIFNWAIEADYEETQRFMETVAQEALTKEFLTLPSVAWAGRTLMNRIPEDPMTVKEYHEGFIELAMKNKRGSIRYEDFKSTLEKAGVPINAGGSYRLPNGESRSIPDTLGIDVHPEVAVAIRTGYGRISHIDCRYFQVREQEEGLPEERPDVIVAFDMGEDNRWEEGEIPKLFNPTIDKLGEISYSMTIIQIIKFKRNKLHQNPGLREMVQEYEKHLPPVS